MELLQTIILGIVQGITELLPISSTAHMLLVSEFIFHKNQSLLFLTTIQFGTTLAILLVYKDFLLRNTFEKGKIKLFINVFIATLPSIIFAILIENYIEKFFYTPYVIALSLLIWGVLMIFVERKYKNPTVNHLTDVNLKQAVLVGIAQAIAIIPGTSRSGSTTVVGIMTGIEKFVALEFSFLLGLPVLIGSFVYEIFKYKDNLELIFNLNNVIGIIVSGAVGFISILVLRRFSKSNFLTLFGYYRIILGILIIASLLF